MGRSNLTPSEIKAKKIISSNLNDLLLKSGKKKIDIQKETHIPRSTISDYFGGKTLPSEENIEKLSKFFNVDKSEIDPRFATSTHHSSKNELNYEDFGLPYKGVISEDLNDTFRLLAQQYAEKHNLPKKDQ